MGRRDATRWLLACGAVGPPLFVIVFLVEGATRPDYDPAHDFVSLLSLTEQGWMQVANFIVSGLLIVAFAVGLHRALVTGRGSRWGPFLVGLVGLGLVFAGVFATDPAQGYPPGTAPGLPPTNSWHANVHFLASSFVFIGLPLASFVLARRFRAEAEPIWAAYSVVSGILMVVLIGATFIAASGPESSTTSGGVAGLLQRASIVSGFLWLTLVALKTVRELPPVVSRQSPAIP